MPIDPTSLCERTREDAYERMVQHAHERGANAVVAMRYDANEVWLASQKYSRTGRRWSWNRV
jgi:uncharacterized protein YbjQ (UPF0145 family)